MASNKSISWSKDVNIFNSIFISGKLNMQLSTIIVLACLVALVAASVHYDHPDEMNVQNLHESLVDTPVHERSARTKRSLLLLKKKLILGKNLLSFPLFFLFCY